MFRCFFFFFSLRPLFFHAPPVIKTLLIALCQQHPSDVYGNSEKQVIIVSPKIFASFSQDLGRLRAAAARVGGTTPRRVVPLRKEPGAVRRERRRRSEPTCSSTESRHRPWWCWWCKGGGAAATCASSSAFAAVVGSNSRRPETGRSPQKQGESRLCP